MLSSAVRHKTGKVIPVLRTGTEVVSKSGEPLAYLSFFVTLSHNGAWALIVPAPGKIGGVESLEDKLPDYLQSLSRLGMQKLPQLTEREREIVEHMFDGMAPKDIAGTRFISEHTVRNHLKSVYRKLGVCSALELVARFARLGGPVPNL